MSDYVTAEDLRVELDHAPDDVAFLSDAAAARLIRNAQAIVEGALGPRLRDDATGRLVVEADVAPWQWENLTAAVLALAAGFKRNPKLLEQGYGSVSGPDFSFSDPRGPQFGREALMLLTASGLMARGARARA